MAMGREGNRQDDLIVTWAEMPRSPGHVFYDRLQEVLIAAGFDRFIGTACQAYYAPKLGAPSLPPGRYVLLGSGSGGLTIDAVGVVDKTSVPARATWGGGQSA